MLHLSDIIDIRYCPHHKYVDWPKLQLLLNAVCCLNTLKGTVNGQLLLFFPLKIFAGVQEIQKHKMLLFVKVPSSNQADFPLLLNWNDKHRSLPGIWHLLWFFFFMSKWQTHNYQGYLIFSCSNSWWHFFLMSFFPSHYLVFSQKWGWRRWWHPTPVLLPGKSHGRRSLVGHGVTQSQTRLKWHCSSSSRSEEQGSA